MFSTIDDGQAVKVEAVHEKEEHINSQYRGASNVMLRIFYLITSRITKSLKPLIPSGHYMYRIL
jgi:hypothetical protein